MAGLCFITTCKGRLAHLKRSLPSFLAQPGTSCVVVDYDCPDGTAAWVAEAHPQATVVKVENRAVFLVSEARNLGADTEAARAAKWLCFIDADNILAPDFAAQVLPLLEDGSFFRPASTGRFDATGLCICSQEDFQKIGGYDSAIRGYGVEDEDLYVRLAMRKVVQKSVPASALSAIIRHDGAQRTAHYEEQDIHLNITMNNAYCKAKWDLMRLKGNEMPLEQRIQLYAYVIGAFRQHAGRKEPLRLKFGLFKQATLTHGKMEGNLVYEFDMVPSKMV